MSEQRRDSIQLPTTLDGRKFSPVTRCGVFEYRNDDGSVRRELRPPEWVFHADSLASLAQVPVTLLHPAEFVTDDTAGDLAVGSTGDSVRRDGDFVLTPLKVWRKDAKVALANGIRELSCGYGFGGLDFTPGVWNGERYDAIQRGPYDYNHVAIVPAARAGATVWYMDGKHQDAPAVGGEGGTVKIKIDGVEVEVADSVGLHVARLQGRADAAESFVEKMKAKHAEPDGDEGEDGKDGKGKKKEDAAPVDADKIRADAVTATRARVALETALTPHLGAEYRCDGKSDADLRKDALAKLAPELDLAGKDDAYVAARLDMAIEAETTRGKGYEGMRQDAANGGATGKSRTDAMHDEYIKELHARQNRDRGITA